NHDKTQEGMKLRPYVEEGRPDCNGCQHGEIGTPGIAAYLPQQTEEQSENGYQNSPLPPGQRSHAEDLYPGVKDEVRQPLGMKPVPAMAGEGEGIREVKSAGLRDPTPPGKVPPEIRALHRGETKGPAGQDDGEPPEESNRSRLGLGRRWRSAFAPGCRPARRRGLFLGARVPHPRLTFYSVRSKVERTVARHLCLATWSSRTVTRPTSCCPKAATIESCPRETTAVLDTIRDERGEIARPA